MIDFTLCKYIKQKATIILKFIISINLKNSKIIVK